MADLDVGIPVDTLSLADTTFILACAALVMLMQGGFCMLEAGLCRAKNSINVAIKNLVDFCASSLVYWAVGFGLMYGNSYLGMIGTSDFIPDASNSGGFLAFVLFQVVFCSTAATIVSGAVAERFRFAGYVLFAIAISALVYPVFGHWVWGGVLYGEATGWLAKLGFIDFAGSTVVHGVGAWSALAAVVFVGPRLGRFERGASIIQGHNLPMAGLGVFLLWFGWFGFNGGSSLAVSESIAKILLNTNLAACAGGVSAIMISCCFERLPSVYQLLNGIVGGLVAITASCNLVSPASSVIIGLIAGAVTVAACYALTRLEIDDVVSAIPIHGVAGVWGTLAVALFAPEDALSFNMTRFQQLGVQALGIFACIVWSFGISYLVLKLLSCWTPLRVSAEEEAVGLNVVEHGATTDLHDLLNNMDIHTRTGEFDQHVHVEPHTEVGEIAKFYNRVLDTVVDQQSLLSYSAGTHSAILDTSLDAIILVDDAGIIAEWNPQAEAIFGWTVTQAVGSPFLARTLAPTEYRWFLDEVDRRNREEVEHSEGRQREIQCIRNNGEIFTAEIALLPIRARGANELCVFLRDISDRKAAEHALVDAKEAAEAANVTKSNFLANMSHEIRTPMTAIIGFAEILAEETSSLTGNDQILHSVDTIRRNGEHLLGIINDILDFSKIEAGKLLVEKTKVDVPKLLHGIENLLAPTATKKGILLSVTFDPSTPKFIQTDPVRLKQILLNIVGNAIKFTSDGEVSLSAHCVNVGGTQQLVFDLLDNGVGMTAEQQKNLFQPFVQADTSTTRMFGGTGLGLSILKQLAVLLGGDLILLNSQPEEGSHFRLTMDLDWSRSGQELDENEVNLPKHTRLDLNKNLPDISGSRILLAEDGIDNQRLVKLILRKAGAEVTVVENGQLALEQATAAKDSGSPFDVILMDMQMPVLDGASATRALRASGYDLPIIALTAHATVGEREKCLGMGCDDYATKPVDRPDLFRKIAHQIKRHLVSP